MVAREDHRARIGTRLRALDRPPDARAGAAGTARRGRRRSPASTAGSIRRLMVREPSRLARRCRDPDPGVLGRQGALSRHVSMPAPRAELAQRMADQVVDAAAPLPVVVVSSARRGRGVGARPRLAVIDDPGSLDSAADAASHGARSARRLRAGRDRPRRPAAAPARWLAASPRTSTRRSSRSCPCHRDDGTQRALGPDRRGVPLRLRRRIVSPSRRRGPAVGLGVRVVRAPDLGFDVDIPADLAPTVDVPCP